MFQKEACQLVCLTEVIQRGFGPFSEEFPKNNIYKSCYRTFSLPSACDGTLSHQHSGKSMKTRVGYHCSMCKLLLNLPAFTMPSNPTVSSDSKLQFISSLLQLRKNNLPSSASVRWQWAGMGNNLGVQLLIKLAFK